MARTRERKLTPEQQRRLIVGDNIAGRLTAPEIEAMADFNLSVIAAAQAAGCGDDEAVPNFIRRLGMGQPMDLLTDLESRRAMLHAYVRMKLEERDYHGVADAAMDLRELAVWVEATKATRSAFKDNPPPLTPGPVTDGD